MNLTKSLIYLGLFCFPEVFAGSMSELIHAKYADIYNPPPPEPLVIENEDGTIETVEILPALSLHTATLTDPEFMEILDNFERNPEAAFTDRRFHTYLIHHAVRDYDTDPYSREILNRCLAYGPDTNFLLILLSVVVNYNREDLFDEIIGQFEGLSFEQRNFFYYNSNLASAIVTSGNYHFAKKLICMGRYPASANYFAASVCSFGRAQKIEEAIDFLDFLIVKRQEVDVNALIRSPRYHEIERPLLMILITGNSQNEFKERVGKYLISIGADVNYQNEFGQTMLQLAQEKGINLL